MAQEDLGLTSLIQSRARDYLPGADGGAIEVRHRSGSLRRWSRIDRYLLRHRVAERSLLVKRARPGIKELLPPPRARLSPAVEADARLSLEYDAMRAIDAHLSETADPRLGRVQVLDRLEEGGIVMEEVGGRALVSLLLRSVRPLAARDARLESAFRHTGTWLRMFAALPDLAGLGSRQASRREVTLALGDLVDDLIQRGEDPRLLGLVKERGPTWTERLLPEVLPLGLGHGDFAARNVLVAPDARVAVIDTRARWRVPIHEDVATFLVSIRANRLQALSRGAAFPARRLAELEAAFLAGRFENEPIPLDTVRLFELLVLLDRWSSASAGPGARRWSGTVVSRLLRRHYAGLVADLVPTLDDAALP